MGQASKVSAAGLAAWHQRFTRTVRLPAALARYLTSDLGLATSSDPATQNSNMAEGPRHLAYRTRGRGRVHGRTWLAAELVHRTRHD